MNIVKKKLESVYNVELRKTKKYCPKSIQYIVEQFVNKKWITDVEYYRSTSDWKFVICGKTKMHHDVFYRNPLTTILSKIGCSVHPNRHCWNILGEGYVVIHVPNEAWFGIKRAEGDSLEGELEGMDAFANVCLNMSLCKFVK